MTKWKKIIKVKHLFTEEKNLDSLQKSMNEIFKVLHTYKEFEELNKYEWEHINQENPLECCEKLFDVMYDLADYNKIWIE